MTVQRSLERPAPASSPGEAFGIVAGCLQVGGVPLTRLAERVGTTPFYAYDRRLISDRVAALREALPRTVRLHYAIKANPMPAVIQHLAPLVDGFDVASAQEMTRALDSGMPAERISFAGPGKSPDELARAVAAGVVIHLESAAETETVADIAARRGRRPPVAVRVNPDFELKTSGMRMGGGAKPFGVDAERVPELLERIGALPLDFRGFHIFSGSQILRAEAIHEAQEKTLALAAALARHAPAPMRHLNIGGGLGIPYFPGDAPLDLGLVGRNLAVALADRAPSLAGADIIVELGRYIVGEAGIYVCRVLDRKVSRGRVFLVTDGGLHHQLAASGNFGQVLRKNYPVAVGNRMPAPEGPAGPAEGLETVDVVGCLCTPLDVLGDRVELPPAEVGDLIVVFQSGAYGLTASPTAFLGHPPPAETLV